MKLMFNFYLEQKLLFFGIILICKKGNLLVVVGLYSPVSSTNTASWKYLYYDVMLIGQLNFNAEKQTPGLT